jgi:S1-C subfamily serine protease
MPAPGRTRVSRPSRAARVAVAALVLGAGAFLAGLSVRSESSTGAGTSAARFVSPERQAGSGASADSDLQQVADEVDDAVVNITTSVSDGQAAGTGMVLTSDGEVLTNFHVIDGATSIEVEIGVSGKTYRAVVVGYDQPDDVALIKLQGASGLDTVDLGDAAEVSVNDQVVAIGNALGQGGSPAAVAGVVSDVGRTITAGGGSESETLTDMIEVQAAIQSGDSGGPIVDTSGKVVGMTTAADVGDGRFGASVATVGYAIPIDRAERIVGRIRAGERSGGVHLGARGYLGVRASDDVSGAGAVVEGVQSGSAADAAGIAAGDVITAIGGTRIDSADQLGSVLGAHTAGDRVRVTWIDDGGSEHRATVTLTDLS